MSKKKIAWVTDSTAYITKELRENDDVYVMPLAIIFPDRTFEDGIDLTTDELYSRINSSKEVPKTSQPSVGRFAEVFEKLKAEYDHVIAVHVSGKLSGTIESSRAGMEMAELDGEIVDSQSMSYTITTLLYKGIQLAEQGVDYKEIAATLREEALRSEKYVLLGSLDQFHKGGRMSKTQFLLGNLLQIKPIITIKTTGEFDLFQKVRSEKKAVNRLIELLTEAMEKHHINDVQIMHGNVEDKALELKKKIEEKYPHLNIVVGEISSTIAVHAGEGTVALIWHNEPK
ncbi:fatty acid-binding protein DegV [Anaerobacillus arseniciselenatis]|uniref:Fatty acid-binding protein DegV n=1 Tax=Anaerobacillus arseniciselenatis TaxID=85682 RepID=A0A1S2L7I9_9BACI|nr:DegV family protein [Anaerobacillus arseniciselenatis]OIJ08316.1 fatty acid-binding protein DegV [Anaerobacillus arseniciselenatis]